MKRTYFGGDLGFVSDSSALVGVTALDESRFEVASIDELRPRKGHPLRPREVMTAFATRMKAFGATEFMADTHARDAAREYLDDHGLRFVNAPGGQQGKEDVYVLARKVIHEGRVKLPNHARFLAQLRSVIAKPLPGGGTQISIPRRHGGGGHGDVCSAFVLALYAASNRRKRKPGGFVASSGYQPDNIDRPIGDMPQRGF